MPLVSADSHALQCPKKVIGAYYMGAVASDYMPPQSLDASTFTHGFYAFVEVSGADYSVIPSNPDIDPELMTAFVDHIVSRNPCGKAFVSIGGIEFSSQRPATSWIFPTLAASPASRQAFITSAIAFARKYRFHGLDIVRVVIRFWFCDLLSDCC